MVSCPKCGAAAAPLAKYCVACGEKVGSQQKTATVASGKHGLRSKVEAGQVECARVERGLFNDNGTAKTSPMAAKKAEKTKQPERVAPVAPMTGSNVFVFRLVCLPGPVSLAYDDGEVIFSTKGKAEVNTELLVKRKGPGQTLKVVLTVLQMSFVANLSYNLNEGSYVTLEATDDGLKNSQLKLK